MTLRAAAFALFLLTLFGGEVLAGSKPNLVLFIADDLGIRDCGPYGNKIVRTPNLNKLAKQSMQFHQAYVASPTCVPSRSAIYTGLMPFRNGAHSNTFHNNIKKGIQTLPHYLQALGYRVALAGKIHVSPREGIPFEYVAQSNIPEPGTDGKLRQDVNLKAVEKWLNSVKKNQPFCLVVGCHSPHVIWPEKADYDPQKVDIPPKHIDTPDTRKARARYYTDITKMDSQLGELVELLRQHGSWDNTLFIFTADNGPQWPFAKWTLYEPGIHMPLLIRWPGQVPGGSHSDALVSLVDLLPTMIEAAGGKTPKNIDGKSLLPVLLGKAKAHRDVIFCTHTGDGQMNRSPARCIFDGRYQYILNLAPEIKYTTHMDKAKDHDGGREYWPSWIEKAKTDAGAAGILNKYHHRPKEELYDWQTDPHQMKNLVDDPKFAPVLNKLRAQLEAWRKGQSDSETGPELVPQG